MRATKADVEIMDEQLMMLAKSREDMLAIMQKQQDMAINEVEASRWERLQDRAERQAEKQAAEQQQAEQQVQMDLQNVTTVANGVGDLTGDQRIKDGMKKFSAFGGIARGMFGLGAGRQSKSSDQQDASAKGPAARPASAGASPQGPGSRAARPPPPMPTTPPPQRIGRHLSVPVSSSVDTSRPRSLTGRPPPPLLHDTNTSRQRSLTNRSPLPPPLPHYAEWHSTSAPTPANQTCRCHEMPRDNVASTPSSTNSLSRPPLPARPQTDGLLLLPKTQAVPPLPPRSPSATWPQAPAKHPSLRSPSFSAPIPTFSVPPHNGRRASTQSSLVPASTPELGTSPTTIASSSSPPTPRTEGEVAFPSKQHSPGHARVEKWIASTAAAANIEMDVLESSSSSERNQGECSVMSVRERRDMFERSAVMGLGVSHSARN